MPWNKVPGKNKSHRIRMFALSYCTPCKKTRQFLEENSVEYEYFNMGEAEPEDRIEAMVEIGEHLPSMGTRLAFPIIIIDESSTVIGYNKERLSKILELG